MATAPILSNFSYSPKPAPSSSPTEKSLVEPIGTSRTVSASEAKTHLLALILEVETQREPITITKRGRPIAQLVPIGPDPNDSIFGCMKGTFEITGDIVAPEPDQWEAML